MGRLLDALLRLPAFAFAATILAAVLTLVGAWLTAVLILGGMIAAAGILR